MATAPAAFVDATDKSGPFVVIESAAAPTAPSWGQPGRAPSILRALRRRCPVCGMRGISRHPAHVHLSCPTCGLDLERQVGSFIGGIGLNTIISFASLLAVLVGGFVATRGEASIPRILVPTLLVSVAVPLLFYARSRLLWVALELIWWPLAPGELSTAQHASVDAPETPEPSP